MRHLEVKYQLSSQIVQLHAFTCNKGSTEFPYHIKNQYFAIKIIH